MKRVNQARWFYPSALAGTIVAYIASNAWWISRESRPPHWDMGRHLLTGLYYQDMFNRHAWHDFVLGYFYYPPLVYWLSLPFLAVHTSVAMAVLSQSLFVVMFAGGTYGLAREIGLRPLLAWLAALLALASPMIVSQFKEFQIDAPLTAVVTLTLYLILRCRNFTRPIPTLLLGLMLGAGMLTKWTFGLIIAVPLAIVIGQTIYQAIQTKDYELFGWIIACLGTGFVIAFPWYWHNHWQIKTDLLQNGVTAGIKEGDPAVGSSASNAWYLNNLLSNQLYLIPALLLGAGLVAAALKRNRKIIYLAAFVVATLLLFTMLRNKDPRYTLPIMGAVAVIGVSWIEQLRKYWQAAAVGIIAAYAIITTWAITAGIPALPRQIGLSIGSWHMTAWAQHGYLIGAPTLEQWHQQDALAYLATLPKGAVYYQGPDTIWFNGWGLQYYAITHKVRLVADVTKATYLLWRGAASNVPDGKRYKSYSLPDGSILTIMDNPK